MANYNRYPAIDEEDNFPPSVRKAMAGSSEVAVAVKNAVPEAVAESIAQDSTVAHAAMVAADAAVRAKKLVEEDNPGIYKDSSMDVKVETFYGTQTALDTVTFTSRVETEGTVKGSRWMPRLLLGNSLIRTWGSLQNYLKGTIVGDRWAEDTLNPDGTVPDWILQRWKSRGAFGVPDNSNTPLDIVIVAGQSNATKRGTVGSDQEPNLPGVVLWNGDNGVVGTAWTPSSGVPWLGSGYGAEWLRRVASLQNRRVGLVRAARGSTGFSSLTPGTWDRKITTGAERYLYPEMVERSKAALAASPTGSKIVAMIWSQGEQDRGMSADAYQAKLDDLLNQFRIDMNLPNLPIIITSMTPEIIATGSAGGGIIQSVLEDTPRRIQRTSYHQGPENMAEQGTGIHWTPQGQSLRGQEQARVSYPRALENVATSLPQSPHSFSITRSGDKAYIKWEHPESRVVSYLIEMSTDEGVTWTTIDMGVRLAHSTTVTASRNLPLWVRGSATNELGTSITSLPKKG